MHRLAVALTIAACGSSPAPSHAGSPAFVQSVSVTESSGSNMAALPAPPGDGALVVAAIAHFLGTVDGVTDSAQNTWTMATEASTEQGGTIELWYATNVHAADPYTVSLTSVAPTQFATIALVEYRGLAALGETGEAQSQGELVSCGTLTTSSSGMVFAAMTTDDATAMASPQDDAAAREVTGFGAPNMFQPLATEDLVPTDGLDTASFTIATATISPSSACVDATFECAGGDDRPRALRRARRRPAPTSSPSLSARRRSARSTPRGWRAPASRSRSCRCSPRPGSPRAR